MRRYEERVGRRRKSGKGRVGGLVACLAVAAAFGPLSAAAQQEVQPGIYRLKGIDDSLPHDDLRPLGGILEGAEFIGLGEAVHTTEGFSRAKVRLFKYLVEEEDVRVFGFESPWIGTESVARYVESCRGSAQKAVQGLFMVWQNTSVRDLVKWMCRYNREHRDDPLYFYGFDIQGQAGENVEALRQLLLGARVAEDNIRVVGLDACYQGPFVLGTEVPESKCVECMSVLDRIERFLERRRKRIIRRTSADDLRWGWIHLVGLRAWEKQIFFSETSRSRSFTSRDEGMAYVATAIRDIRFPEARTALWAHNAHISKKQRFTGFKDMGAFLYEAAGVSCKSVGLIAFQAEIDWPKVGCGPTVSAKQGSVEWLLWDLGERYLLVDLDFPGASEPLFEPGVTYDINWGNFQIPADNYDALVYMNFAARMIPVNRPPC